MEKINRIIKSFSNEEVKTTYVLSLMAQKNLISVEDKTEIKKGLQTSQQKFKNLANEIKDLNDFVEISEVLLLFLKHFSKKLGEDEIVQEINLQRDISPDTFDIILDSEDSSPSDNALFHRKLKRENYQYSEKYSLHLI